MKVDRRVVAKTVVAVALLAIAYSTINGVKNLNNQLEMLDTKQRQTVEQVEKLETEQAEIKAKNEKLQKEKEKLKQSNLEKERSIQDLQQELQAKKAEEALAEQQRLASLSVTSGGRGGVDYADNSWTDNANSYAYGYCTWYVANKRYVPSGLGNANTWDDRAPSHGFTVSTVPVAGAIAQTDAGYYGHVAYVESVNGDGTVNISEMNYNGWNVISGRTVPVSDFVYIY